MSGRCTLAKARELLAPDFTSMEAAVKVTQAIHEHDRFPLYCNGEVVKPHIRAIANVVPKAEEDDWDIESTGPGLGWARGAYNWELEDDAVLALKPQPDTRVEAAQATAISAMQLAETSAAEAKAARTEAEQARAELEQARAALQAATKRMEKAEARMQAAETGSETATDNPERRRPGTKPKYPEWRVDATIYIRQFSRKKKRKPGAGEIAAHFQEKFGWEPEEKDIRDLLKFLIRD